MKTFLQFITESTATQQAARLGLVSDGHGGWTDRTTGEFVAKTEKGRLKFFNKRQKVGGKDPAQSEKEKNLSDPNMEVPPEGQQEPQQEPAPDQQQQQQQVQSPDLAAGPPPVPKTKGTLTLAFGRFNPPHAGHQQLMDIAAQSAEQEESDYIIVPSRSQDPKKNPLDADTKVSMMRQMFPQHSERIVNDGANRTIFDVLKKAHNDGYTNVRIVAGQDRVKEFDKLSQNYNGQLYQFDNMEVISSGDRDPDAEGMEGLSSSRMRLAAAEGDFKTFRAGLPEDTPRKMAMTLFDTVRQTMNVKEMKEFWNIWEIAPKYDLENLRESYIAKKIFNIGDRVENLNTGLIGRIIRRGANHLICVAENNIMFKSWVKDLQEAVVNATTPSGVPANQRLTGTDALRKYVETMVPGSTYGIQFINKYKVRK
jgi:nicotinamide mononucleotide adenylyltransferase/ribosomal protein L31